MFGDKISNLRNAGMSERDATMQTIAPKKKGQKVIKFKKGGLHASTDTPADEPIPASKHAAAASGKLGPKAKAQESFYENVLGGDK